MWWGGEARIFLQLVIRILAVVGYRSFSEGDIIILKLYFDNG